MADRELLELAAKAAGIEVKWVRNSGAFYYDNPETGHEIFDPLTDDGDALRLAATLGLTIEIQEDGDAAAYLPGQPGVAAVEWAGPDPDRMLPATRRAIVRAAAAIGGNTMNPPYSSESANTTATGSGAGST